MSHWTTLKVKAKDREAIKKALKRLFPKNDVVENATVRGFSGATKKADIVCKGDNNYDVGFVKSSDTYDCVADWYGAAHWAGRQNEFTGSFNQAYAAEAVKIQAKKAGYSVNEKQLTDGRIQLTVQQY